jgi:hypothetical protein
MDLVCVLLTVFECDLDGVLDLVTVLECVMDLV